MEIVTPEDSDSLHFSKQPGRDLAACVCPIQSSFPYKPTRERGVEGTSSRERERARDPLVRLRRDRFKSATLYNSECLRPVFLLLTTSVLYSSLQRRLFASLAGLLRFPFGDLSSFCLGFPFPSHLVVTRCLLLFRQLLVRLLSPSQETVCPFRYLHLFCSDPKKVSDEGMTSSGKFQVYVFRKNLDPTGRARGTSSMQTPYTLKLRLGGCGSSHGVEDVKW